MRALVHLMRTAFHALFRLFVIAFFCASLAAVGTLIMSYAATHQWPPRHMTMVALIVIAALTTYAGVVTALLIEVLRGIFKTVEAVDHELVGAAHTAERDLEPGHSRSRAS
ncbi:MAG: hypothetical protein ACRDHE_09040 [Ktedonobacterales bacterium]